ncbi:MAG: flippase [Candidatus Nealsonbacteria bacterium]
MIVNNLTDIKSLLFDNKSLKQTVFKNTFWLAIAEGITRILKLFLIIYVARILGATEYGKFSFALSFVSLFAVFSDFGLNPITVRELSREKEKDFPFILSLKTFLSLGTLILIFIGSFFITPDIVVRKLIWILAIYILINSFSGIVYCFFRARQQMEYESFAKIFQAITVTGAGFFIIFNFPSAQNLSFSYLFATTLTLFFILLFFRFKFYPLKLSFNKAVWQNLLKMTWPLGLAGMFSGIYGNIGSIIMGNLGQITEAGWYNAAFKLVGITMLPINLISTSFFPVLSKFFKESKESLQKVWNYYIRIMIFFAVPLAVGGVTLAPKIIDFVYDPSYFPSISAFQILIVMVSFSFILIPFSQMLIISDHQKKNLWIAFAGAITNSVLGLILIPYYSLYGTAITILISTILMFFLFFIFSVRLTHINPISLDIIFHTIGVLIASALMYFIISCQSIYNLYILKSILIGVTTYLISFLGYKKLTSNFLSIRN